MLARPLAAKTFWSHSTPPLPLNGPHDSLSLRTFVIFQFYFRLLPLIAAVACMQKYKTHLFLRDKNTIVQTLKRNTLAKARERTSGIETKLRQRKKNLLDNQHKKYDKINTTMCFVFFIRWKLISI